MVSGWVKRVVRGRLGPFEFTFASAGLVCGLMVWCLVSDVEEGMGAFVERGLAALFGNELSSIEVGGVARAGFVWIVFIEMWLVSMRLRHAGLPAWAAFGLLVPRLNVVLLVWSAIFGARPDPAAVRAWGRFGASAGVMGLGVWGVSAAMGSGSEAAVFLAPFAPLFVAFASAYAVSLFGLLRLGQCCAVAFGVGTGILAVASLGGLPVEALLYGISPISMALVIAGAFLAFELQPHLATRGKNLPCL
jgi:hypothetical protein